MLIRVRIPSPLRSYTEGASDVTVALPSAANARPPTLAAVLAALDAQHRGLRFRIVDEQDRLRPHIKVFVGSDVVRDLASPVAPDREVMIVAALSGG